MIIENFEGVVWDFDGTMLDSMNSFTDILREVVAETGHEMPSRETILENYHGTLKDTFKAVFEFDTEESVDFMENLFCEKQEVEYANGADALLFDDAVHLAQQIALKGIPQFIITNRKHNGSGKASPHSIIAASDLLEGCIKEIRCGDEVVVNKPEPQVLEGWFEKHGIPPEKLIVIGDQKVDARLALKIGARAILVSRHPEEYPHTLEHKDVIIVESLHNIKLA